MLTPSRYAVMARLYEEVGNAVSAVVTMHNELLKEALNGLMLEKPTLVFHEHYQTWMMHEGDIDDIDSFGVDVSWTESARGCRTGGGSHRIRREAICESTRRAFLEEKVATHIAAIRKEVEGKDVRELAWKRARLEKLKQ